MRMPKRKRLDISSSNQRSSSTQVLNGENVCEDKQTEFNNSVSENNEKTVDSSPSSSSLLELEPVKKKLNFDNNQESLPLDRNAINSNNNADASLSHRDNSECSPPTANNNQQQPQDCFKTPLNPNDIASLGIRRKSNRILSLKRLNQNSPLVTSSSEDIDCSNQQQTSSHSDKPQQTSDVSSTLNPGVNSGNNQNKPTTSNPSNSGKSLRKIQAWTEDDIRWFFEALCEHGKDFPHIQSYIASRCEKKGIPQDSIKNYEQVRHFYYRMWHKISLILKISPEVDKAIQEIYGLINYGEIWKKFGSKFECKFSLYLQQLVDFGYTVIKMKGKSVRIRTPVCNALKKIHNIDNKINKQMTQPMPKEIIIELIPATNSDWLRVHCMAQNPRLRTKLTMQHRLSTLISYLEKRWNIGRLHQNVFRSVLGTDLIENKDDNIEKENKAESSANKPNCNNRFYIRLRPQTSTKMCDSITLKSTGNSISYHNHRSTTHGTTQIDLSLSAYMKNMFNDSANAKKSKIRKKKPNSTIQNSVDESNSNRNQKEEVNDNNKDNEQKDDTALEDSKEHIETDEPQPTFLFKLLDSMNEELEVSQSKNNQKNNSYSSDCWKSNSPSSKLNETNEPSVSTSINDANDEESRLPEPPAHQTLAQWLAGDLNDEVDDDDQKDDADQEEESKNLNNKPDNITESSSSSSSQTKQNDAKTSMIGNRKRRVSNSENETVELLTAEKARQGWDLDAGKTVTVGELYLLFCQPSKIILEYSWICEEPKQTETDNKEMNDQDNPTTQIKTEEDTSSIDEPEQRSLSTVEKFLIAANLTLMNHKKTSQSNNQSSSSSNFSNSVNLNNKSSRSKRGSREKNSMTTSSSTTNPLLFNLIQETILNDDDPNNAAKKSLNDDSTKQSGSKSVVEDKTSTTLPTTPATNQKQNKCRSSAVDDPTKVEEVLKELKIRGRQRRLQTKFMYNHQPNKMINLNGSINRPTVLFIRTAAGEGSNSKQIVLTANMPSNHPQTASISLAPVGNLTSTTAAISLPASSNNDQFTTPNITAAVTSSTTPSVLIPVQLETKPSSLSTATTIISNRNESTTYLQLVPQATIKNQPIQQEQPNFIVDNQQTTTQNKLTSNSHQESHSSSHIPWLQDISLGSLFCDTNTNTSSSNAPMISPTKSLNIPANIETTPGSSLSSLPNDFETHLNTFANDNSVDLMAKFADLAEQITSQDIKTTIQ